MAWRITSSRDGPSEQVALLDVERSALLFALEVSVDVGHHDLVGALHPVEGCGKGPRTNGDPVTMSAKSE